MPQIPNKLVGGGGNVTSPGMNKCYIQSVADVSSGTQYDLCLDIVFGFIGAPDDWTRRWRLFGKFEKDAHGNIDPNCKDVRQFYTIMAQLDFTEIEFDASGNIAAIKSGICLGDKGNFVTADDKPIKDIAALMMTISKDHEYSVLLVKNETKNGEFDKVVIALDEAVAGDANNGNENAMRIFTSFSKSVDYALKKVDTANANPMDTYSVDDIEYIPGS